MGNFIELTNEAFKSSAEKLAEISKPINANFSEKYGYTENLAPPDIIKFSEKIKNMDFREDFLVMLEDFSKIVGSPINIIRSDKLNKKSDSKILNASDSHKGLIIYVNRVPRSPPHSLASNILTESLGIYLGNDRLFIKSNKGTVKQYKTFSSDLPYYASQFRPATDGEIEDFYADVISNGRIKELIGLLK